MTQHDGDTLSGLSRVTDLMAKLTLIEATMKGDNPGSEGPITCSACAGLGFILQSTKKDEPVTRAPARAEHGQGIIIHPIKKENLPVPPQAGKITQAPANAEHGQGIIIRPIKKENLPVPPQAGNVDSIANGGLDQENFSQSIPAVPSASDTHPNDLFAAMAAVMPPLPQNTTADKWYCVTVGMRVGVVTSWSIASSFTNKVSGSSQVSYRTREAAEGAFNSARALGRVKVVLSSGVVVVV